MIHVVMRDIGGRELALEASAETSIQALKVKVAEAWQVHPMCQRLIKGAEALKDSDTLESLCSNDLAPLSIMVVVSVGEALKRLDHANRHIRQEAIKAFGQIAPKGHRGAVAAIGPLLSDSASETRVSALEALARVAADGNEHAIDLALGCITDVRADVRCATLRALSQLSPAGHKAAMIAMVDCISDKEAAVRANALQSLTRSVPKGNADAIQAVCLLLKHGRAEVRGTALKAIVSLASANDETVISAIGELIEDREPSLRQEVLMAYCVLIPDKHEREVALAMARLHYGRTDVRLAALNALTKMTLDGNQHVVIALSAVLKNRDRGIRLKALRALLRAAPKGSKDALLAVGSCLHDRHAEVRQAALLVVAKMAQGSDAGALSMLGSCFEHADRAMVQNAKEALVELMPSAEERAAFTSVAALEHGGPQRKQIAWQELVGMVAKGNCHAVKMVSNFLSGPEPRPCQEMLGILATSSTVHDESVLDKVIAETKHSDPAIRFSALSALASIAPKGHAGATEATCALLEDALLELRMEACSKLGRIAEHDSTLVLSALASRLKHKHSDVKRAALKALVQVCTPGNAHGIAVASTLLEDVDGKVRQEAMKVLNGLAPKGHENLAIVGPSVQHAILASSSRLMRRQTSTSNVLSQAGQRVGQQEKATQALEDKLTWNECKRISFAATAYQSKMRGADPPKFEWSRPEHCFQDLIASSTCENFEPSVDLGKATFGY
jgi:hypothetical protein